MGLMTEQLPRTPHSLITLINLRTFCSLYCSNSIGTDLSVDILVYRLEVTLHPPVPTLPLLGSHRTTSHLLLTVVTYCSSVVSYIGNLNININYIAL